MGLFSRLWKEEPAGDGAEPEGYPLEVLLSGWVTLPAPLEQGFALSIGKVLDQTSAR